MALEIIFKNQKLEKLENDPEFNGGFDLGAVRAFRKIMQFLHNAKDERDLYAVKSLHYEKLEGKRQHQRSVRLNSQWRLILEIKGKDDRKKVMIIDIEDYH